MQSLEEFNIFKAEECQERLCPCYRGNHGDDDELPDDYAECPCFHNKQDKRREPFLDLVTCRLAYQATEPVYSAPDPEGCRNDIEYKYHPKNFKALPCKRCPGYYCPYFHDQEEKQKWDKLLRKPSPLKFSGEANNDMKNEKSNTPTIQIEKGNIDAAQRSKSVMKTQDTYHKPEGIDPDHLKNQYFDFDFPSSNQRESLPALSLYEQIASNLKGEHNTNKINASQNSKGREEEKIEVVHKNSYEKILEESLDKTTSNPLKNFEQGENGSWKIVGNGPLGQKVSSDKAYSVQEIENFKLKKSKPVLNDIPFTYGSRIYIHKEKVQMLDISLHDYYCLGRIVSFHDLVEQHVCAFLNSSGGVIYFGINENFQSIGVKMDRKMLDDLSITFDRKLKSFSPPVRADQYNIKACYVFDKQQRMYSKDHYVIEIEIIKGDPSELYFNDRGACYMRKNNISVCLDTQAIKNEVRIRTQKNLANNLVELIDNIGFDEGLRGIKDEKRSEDLLNIKRLIQEKINLIDKIIGEDQGNYGQFLHKLQIGQENNQVS